MPTRFVDGVAEIQCYGRDINEQASRLGGEATHDVVEQTEVDNNHGGADNIQMSVKGIEEEMRKLLHLAGRVGDSGVSWDRAFHGQGTTLACKRQYMNSYVKVVEWLSLIGKELRHPSPLQESVCIMDEAGVLLSVLSCPCARDERQSEKLLTYW